MLTEWRSLSVPQEVVYTLYGFCFIENHLYALAIKLVREKKLVVKHSQIICEVYVGILKSIVYKPAVLSINEFHNFLILGWFYEDITLKFQWDSVSFALFILLKIFLFILWYAGDWPRAMNLIGMCYHWHLQLVFFFLKWNTVSHFTSTS